MIALQKEEFDVSGVFKSMQRDECGASVIFIGTVKSPIEGRNITCLELESYKDMAYKELKKIEREARESYDIADACVIHRYGTLNVGDPIVLIVVVSVERSQAYECSRYILEKLKERVPIFKKEHTDSESYWHGE